MWMRVVWNSWGGKTMRLEFRWGLKFQLCHSLEMWFFFSLNKSLHPGMFSDLKSTVMWVWINVYTHITISPAKREENQPGLLWRCSHLHQAQKGALCFLLINPQIMFWIDLFCLFLKWYKMIIHYVLFASGLFCLKYVFEIHLYHCVYY